MKKLLLMGIKDLKLMFRDRAALMFMLLVPFLLTIGMLFAMMGGCMYPLELFPPAIQSAVRILPTTWAMEGMLDLGLRGGGLPDILLEAGVLLGFAVVFFSVGVVRFRYE